MVVDDNICLLRFRLGVVVQVTRQRLVSACSGDDVSALRKRAADDVYMTSDMLQSALHRNVDALMQV